MASWLAIRLGTIPSARFVEAVRHLSSVCVGPAYVHQGSMIATWSIYYLKLGMKSGEMSEQWFCSTVGSDLWHERMGEKCADGSML